VEPGVDGQHVYVACNGHGEVLEIDLQKMVVTRTFPTGKAPYNLEVTADGRLLIATNKGDQSVSVIDVVGGDELARIPTSRPITHGVVATPDSRYAFVTNEAVGATFSTVDVIDLRSLGRVAEVEVEHQAGGIDFWRQE
jgi:DNA-binding beta-propeller fold protein YncE